MAQHAVRSSRLLTVSFVLVLGSGSVAAITETPQDQIPSIPQKTESPNDTSLTFVQITDAHLFDAGRDATNKPEAAREQEDSRAALRWAVAQINNLISAGSGISFVVFTGDLGLYLVRTPGENTCNTTEDVKDYNRIKTQGWPKLLIPKQAAKELASYLSALKAQALYFVPGNNDLAGEDPCDVGRYQDFIRTTAGEIGGNGPKLFDLATLDVGDSPAYAEYRLIGLNSATFKEKKDYQTTCAKREANGNPQFTSGCPDFEFYRLNEAVRLNQTYLIFTHVPDLQDPWRRENNKECRAVAESPKKHECDSWGGFTNEERLPWEHLVGTSNIAAIFAGHFHARNRSLYATRADNTPLVVSAVTATKTWVAPPLSAKNQGGQFQTAQGLVLIQVQRQATGSDVLVSAIPFWYPGLYFQNTWSSTHLWLIALAVSLAVLFVVIWYLRKTWPPDYFAVLRHPMILTSIGLVIVALLTWQTMDFITTHMTYISFSYWLIPVFGALGGVVGGLLRSDNRLILCRYEERDRIKMGIVGDIVIGMGGATALAALFGNTLNLQPNQPSSATLLISLSFVAGVFGRAVVQQAGEKILQQVREEAKQVARQEAAEVVRRKDAATSQDSIGRPEKE